MEIEAMVNRNIFTKGILKLISDNPGRSYTTKELVEAKHLFSYIPQVKKSVELLVKQGSIKVKIRGSELCYQVMPIQKK
ncbi:MAG: hypothetical protein JW967_11135 [Dehalococcoidales bacterium]|nr:hypothetical protein [Dehalococcoidales bacterium]